MTTGAAAGAGMTAMSGTAVRAGISKACGWIGPGMPPTASTKLSSELDEIDDDESVRLFESVSRVFAGLSCKGFLSTPAKLIESQDLARWFSSSFFSCRALIRSLLFLGQLGSREFLNNFFIRG